MIEELYSYFRQSSGICTDTRQLKKDQIYFALKGPNFDGNKFASFALEHGALISVIDNKASEIPGKTILVDDTLQALQELAAFHRKKITIPIIGITGSNGKTTTKELINAVLSTTYTCFATQGNLNNHIGVPLSLLSIRPETEIAVIEMGANHIGEIHQLCQLARPTHGLITNIGRAHTGLFGGFEGVIRAKSELYDFLIKNEGTVFINENQDILKNMGKRFKNPLYYPGNNSFCPSEFLAADPFVQVRTENGNTFTSGLIGKYNFDNIATALTIAKYFKVDEQSAIDAIAQYLPSNNRSQVLKKDKNTLILDAYNANPSSMEKALESFASMKASKKGVILGDMFELGNDSAAEHKKIGELVEKLAFDLVLFCGKDMIHAYQACKESIHFETKDQLIKFIDTNKPADTTILIKASRGMALEELVAHL